LIIPVKGRMQTLLLVSFLGENLHRAIKGNFSLVISFTIYIYLDLLKIFLKAALSLCFVLRFGFLQLLVLQ